MTAKTIREIKFEKGQQFTTEFILDFDQDWNEVTQMFKSRHKDIEIDH